MPFLSPTAIGDRLAEGDAHVFHRVVAVDVQVAVGLMSRSIRPWRAIWSSMWSKKPMPVAAGLAGAVQVDRTVIGSRRCCG
jgi:hypothetical protein